MRLTVTLATLVALINMTSCGKKEECGSSTKSQGASLAESGSSGVESSCKAEVAVASEEKKPKIDENGNTVTDENGNIIYEDGTTSGQKTDVKEVDENGKEIDIKKPKAKGLELSDMTLPSTLRSVLSLTMIGPTIYFSGKKEKPGSISGESVIGKIVGNDLTMEKVDSVYVLVSNSDELIGVSDGDGKMIKFDLDTLKPISSSVVSRSFTQFAFEKDNRIHLGAGTSITEFGKLGTKIEDYKITPSSSQPWITFDGTYFWESGTSELIQYDEDFNLIYKFNASGVDGRSARFISNGDDMFFVGCSGSEYGTDRQCYLTTVKIVEE